MKPVVRLIVPALFRQRTPRCRKPRAERPAGVHHAAGYQIFPAQTFAVLFVATALALRDIVSGRPASPAAPPGGMLALAFLCGVALFLNRTRIAFSHWLLLLSLIGFGASVLASNRNREDLAALFFSYLAVYLGLLNFQRRTCRSAADCAWHLPYAFTVQRTVAQRAKANHLMPSVSRPFRRATEERPFFALSSNASDRVDDAQECAAQW
ncbi:hypothetical protein [Bradyrhizobium liaoningense]